MKVWFWKNVGDLFGYIFIIIISFLLLITSIILTIKNIEKHYPMLIFSLLMFMIGIVLLFTEKRLLSKVLFTEKGIEWQRLKKKIAYIEWYEIIDVKETIRSISSSWLTFISKESKIDVDLTNKMYNAIMILCPYPNIKAKINSLPMMEYWKKKNKKLIEKQKKK